MVQDVIIQISQWLRPYVSDVAMMVVATLLVLYGNEINGLVRRHIHHWHFVFRTAAFILLCAFGYGLATNWASPFLARQLAGLSNLYLGPVVVIVTIALGVLAERKRQV